VAPSARLAVHGRLVLANEGDWRRAGGQRCEGEGLYDGLERGVRVRVLDFDSKPLAVTRLRAGRIRQRNCRFEFRFGALPISSEGYRFEIGLANRAGLIFRDTRGLASLQAAKGNVTFIIGTPAERPRG
jgi:hypothetical protein